MNAVLESSRERYKNLTEIYEVVKTVEVVRDGKTRYRLEVIKEYRGNTSVLYDVLCWRHEHFHIQPSYPRSGGKFEKEPEDARILVPGHMPALNNPTAEGALRQALNFLATGDL